MRGYNDGYDECSGAGDSDDSSDDSTGDFEADDSRQTNGGSVNWENLCMRYGDRIGISAVRCDQYADGTQLTQAGEDFLVCNLITRVGPAVLGLDVAGIGVGSILAELC